MSTVYRHYDKDMIPLYIGVADDLSTRHKVHAKQSEWWSLVYYTALDTYQSRTEAELAEKLAIAKEKPIYNKALSQDPLRPISVRVPYIDSLSRPRYWIRKIYPEAED